MSSTVQRKIIQNVKITSEFGALEYPVDENIFTEIHDRHHPTKNPMPNDGIIRYLSLNTLLNYINTCVKSENKHGNPAILKGLYKGGISGVDCYENCSFLPFDVDVKNTKDKKENVHLMDAIENQKVFDALKEIAVIIFRSNSGRGMAGFLYVPQLLEIGVADKKKHKTIGEAINEHLRLMLLNKGLIVKFDSSQNAYRQTRLLAEQTAERKLNLKPLKFNYKITEKEAVTSRGLAIYKHKKHFVLEGSIEEQFNNNTNIRQVLEDNGFKQTGDNRYLKPGGSSESSGEVNDDENLYFNYSPSFSRYGVFTPFFLALYLSGLSRYNFVKELKKQGYEKKQPRTDLVSEAITKFRNRDLQAPLGGVLFEAFYPLRALSIKERLEFVSNTGFNTMDKHFIYNALKLNNLKLFYKHKMVINEYVSDKLNDVLGLADRYRKVIVRADTGTGKTTAFLRYFKDHRPNSSCLIIAPLTVIVDQIKNEYKEIDCLTGNSSKEERRLAYASKGIVVATYEQGVNMFLEGKKFDYVVIDEAHELINANAYKKDKIKELSFCLKESKIIGLTGTPSMVFELMGYTLIDLCKYKPKPSDVHFITSNISPYKIVLQHLENVKGKAIFRVNSKAEIDALYKELKKKYKKNQVLRLYSDNGIKEGKEFKNLAKNRCFEDNVKIVLTTSIIDAGLSIEQKGFTDVVFIETGYKPNPEPLKQFLARFRNQEEDRKYYCYFKQKNNEVPHVFDSALEYKKKTKLLEEIRSSNQQIELSAYYSIANDDDYFLKDKTVNKLMVAYDVNNLFFRSLSKEEYYYYLKENYNINPITEEVVNSISDLNISTKEKNQDKKQKEELIYNYWTEYNQGVLASVRKHTKDKSLKIENLRYNPLAEVEEFVYQNIKAFESIIKSSKRLKSINVNDPNKVIFKNGKRKNSKQLENEMILAETTALYDAYLKHELTNEGDKRQAKKIDNFINQVNELTFFKPAELEKIWSKQRVANNKGYSKTILVRLVNKYCDFSFKTKGHTYYKN